MYPYESITTSIKGGKQGCGESYRHIKEQENTTDIFYVLYKESCGPRGCVFFDDWVYRKSLHQPVKLMGVQTSCFGGSTRPGKVSIFHTLCKKQETITFPDESFYLVGPSATEEKKSVWNKDG